MLHTDFGIGLLCFITILGLAYFRPHRFYEPNYAVLHPICPHFTDLAHPVMDLAYSDMDLARPVMDLAHLGCRNSRTQLIIGWRLSQKLLNGHELSKTRPGRSFNLVLGLELCKGTLPRKHFVS